MPSLSPHRFGFAGTSAGYGHTMASWSYRNGNSDRRAAGPCEPVRERSSRPGLISRCPSAFSCRLKPRLLTQGRQMPPRPFRRNFVSVASGIVWPYASDAENATRTFRRCQNVVKTRAGAPSSISIAESLVAQSPCCLAGGRCCGQSSLAHSG